MSYPERFNYIKLCEPQIQYIGTQGWTLGSVIGEEDVSQEHTVIIKGQALSPTEPFLKYIYNAF